MGNFNDIIEKHKKFSYALGIGFIVFINCFGFPIYNLNKEWSVPLIALKICTVLSGAWVSGNILAIIFQKKNFFLTIIAFFIGSGVGLICRLLVEFGEVSILYDFTLPNFFSMLEYLLL